MPQLSKISKNNTTIRNEGSETVVTLHWTDIVRVGPKKITLNSGGWQTATTKNRMNQVSNEWGLGYWVSQLDYTWYVTYNEKTEEFYDGITINRK